MVEHESVIEVGGRDGTYDAQYLVCIVTRAPGCDVNVAGRATSTEGGEQHSALEYEPFTEW